MQAHLRSPALLALVVGLAALAAYGLTLAPTVGLTDSGELTAAAYTLGIAHPPGFSLYVLLGWLFARIPFGSVAWRLNLMSAFLGAAAVAVMFLWLRATLPAAAATPGKGARKRIENGIDRDVAAAGGALCLAFGITLWNWATVAEVYTLQVLLLSGLLAAFFAAMRSGNRQWWGLAGLSFGLGLANHHVMTLLFVPGLLLYLLLLGRQKVQGRAWAFAAAGILAGLAFYLYLPLRAAQSPLFNWGNPVNLQRFWWHVSGRQYQVNLFSVPLSALAENLGYGLRLWWSQFTPAGFLVAAFGLAALWKRDRKAALFSVAVILVDVAFASHYDIAEDSDAYFLPAFMMTTLWIASGAYAGLAWLREKGRLKVGWAALGLLVALNLGLHWTQSDKHRLWLPYDYATQSLAELETGGTLLTRDWQAYSPLLYLQHVEGMRADARVIDVELLRRTWYLDYLAEQYPDLLARCQAELDAYREQLRLFEYGLPYDAAVIQERYIALLNALICEGQPSHVGLGMEAGVGTGYATVPLGVTIALRESDAFEPFDTRSVRARGLSDGSIHADAVVGKIRRAYAWVRTMRAAYLAQYSLLDQALATLHEAARLDPEFSAPHRLAGDLYAQLGRLAEARAAYLRALEVNPQDLAAQEGLMRIGAQ